MSTLVRVAVSVFAVITNTLVAASGQEDPQAEDRFSIVLLPDTQFYSESHAETYVAQTLWIRQKQADVDTSDFRSNRFS